jgi:hypothetical protein
MIVKGRLVSLKIDGVEIHLPAIWREAARKAAAAYVCRRSVADPAQP